MSHTVIFDGIRGNFLENPKNNLKIKNQATSKQFQALSDLSAKLKNVVFITAKIDQSKQLIIYSFNGQIDRNGQFGDSNCSFEGDE